MSWTAEVRKFASDEEWQGNNARFALRVDAVEYGESLNAQLANARITRRRKRQATELPIGQRQVLWKK